MSPVIGSEDCLYLNIYRPNTNPSITNYDVLFYVHGGAFSFGTSNSAFHGPSYFMDTGKVILVVPQYRLGPMGFLSTGDEACPGNFGLKDQAMALKWVHQHIGRFGGNPRSITVMGHSSGASSVHMLQISPLTKGLIRGVIALSGTALNPWNFPTKDPQQWELAKRHAQLLNISNVDRLTAKQLVEELRKVPAELIISTVPQLLWKSTYPMTLYRTVIEGFETPSTFLKESPYSALKRGAYAKVPVLFTFAADEAFSIAMKFIKTKGIREAFNKDVDNLLPQLLEYDKKYVNVTEKIKKKYHLTKGVHDKNSENGVQKVKMADLQRSDLQNDQNFIYFKFFAAFPG